MRQGNHDFQIKNNLDGTIVMEELIDYWWRTSVRICRVRAFSIYLSLFSPGRPVQREGLYRGKACTEGRPVQREGLYRRKNLRVDES
jgi:hypothetical protein